jgi:hypothetical protein
MDVDSYRKNSHGSCISFIGKLIDKLIEKLIDKIDNKITEKE